MLRDCCLRLSDFMFSNIQVVCLAVRSLPITDGTELSMRALECLTVGFRDIPIYLHNTCVMGNFRGNHNSTGFAARLSRANGDQFMSNMFQVSNANNLCFLKSVFTVLSPLSSLFTATESHKCRENTRTLDDFYP
jgi:hypothetical protein